MPSITVDLLQRIHHATWINYWTARHLVIPLIKDEFLMSFGLYFFGGFLVMSGTLRVSSLLVFALYYKMFSDAVNSVSGNDADLQVNMPYSDRLLESLTTQRTGDILGGGIIPDNSNTIRLDRVSFRYPGTETKLLDNFNLQIAKGERVAITGRSGCGKTTLLKLITGLLTPDSGEVSISGVKLGETDLETLHQRIGFIMQENTLFNTTIRENLLYGKEDATDDEMREACQKAYILDYIDTLPKGLDTVIGEKGIRLSGGQRQRMVLARMFLRDVDIILFDEATSALDQYSENIIQDAIRSISTGKTLIVVAHRESSLHLCDRVIVME